jgi:hypothetical protein
VHLGSTTDHLVKTVCMEKRVPPGSLIPPAQIERIIVLVRGQKVLLDADLADLYGVRTKALIQSVKRNRRRFPADFMFQLTWAEARSSRSQIVTLDDHRGSRGRHSKYRPYAFTEQGVAMLSSVLRSRRAIDVNVEIMRAFVRLRQIVASHGDLARKLDELEKKYDHQFRVVFDAIRELMAPPAPKRRSPIGFRPSGRASPNPK